MVAMRLALACGTLDVDGLLETIGSRQWIEWLAFHEIEPFGPIRDDERSGVICETIAIANQITKKGTKERLKWRDFFGRSMLGIDRQKLIEKERQIQEYNRMMAQAQREARKD
jgi:hypothetical protein